MKIIKILKKNFIYIVPIVMSIIMLAALLTFNFTYAKYVNKSSVTYSARVARVVVDIIENGANQKELLYKNQNYEYYFTVTNQKDGVLSEVEVEYNLKIDDKGSAYIDETYSLYKISLDGTRTNINLVNGATPNSQTLGKIEQGTTNIVYDAHDYVIVYNASSVTSVSTDLFTINVIATQKN